MAVRRGQAQDRERRGRTSLPQSVGAQTSGLPYLRLPLGGRWKRGGRPDSTVRLQTTSRRYDGLAQDTSSNLYPGVLRNWSLRVKLESAGGLTCFLAVLAGMPALCGCATTPTAIAREQRVVNTAPNVAPDLMPIAPALPPPAGDTAEALLAAGSPCRRVTYSASSTPPASF